MLFHGHSNGNSVAVDFHVPEKLVMFELCGWQIRCAQLNAQGFAEYRCRYGTRHGYKRFRLQHTVFYDANLTG